MLLGSSGSLAIKCVAMNNQKCLVRSTLTDLNSDEILYYPFINSIDRCDGSCNTVEDSFGRTCVHNKMKSVNLKVFNMIKGIY